MLLLLLHAGGTADAITCWAVVIRAAQTGQPSRAERYGPTLYEGCVGKQ